ncbi:MULTISPECIES: hypothetical protein [unclassified Rhodococcus (in: high G+C Gram-positive bacteria)]|uniref:hypothetical protein n=1 Tax=unclassified Rhodococcus (in: high G+C Gram-positive bacteria) TaxID=192944 RepID=UPI001639F2AD|nr:MULTISPECIES: hypothetical protein [unclassified Rhodococcus (in: high G+C Gram-positive bacteria)]MBC2638184.1 hypothetical protein [Rhodococcus sp. 3A]MBC2897073.1 hypothetical protein [Rhodococcus sp. 4CII]
MRYIIEGTQPDNDVVLMDSVSEIESGDAHKFIVAGSARIGDARDVYENGEISVVNEPAEELGIRPGMTTKQFIDAVSSRSRV